MADVSVNVIGMDEFNTVLSDFAAKAVPSQFNAIMKKVIIDIITGVVYLSPVISGRLRGGWQASIGEMSSDDNTPEDKNGGPTIRRAVANITSGASNKDLIGETGYIYNNVSYALFVEFGTPKMAPRAMLREAIMQVQSSMS